MPASQGVAKRASINIKSHFDQEAIDRFEHSLKALSRSGININDAFDRANQSFDRFNEHMEIFTQHHSAAMDKLRESDNRAVASDRRLNQRLRDTADTYNHNGDRFSEVMHHMNEAENERSDNQRQDDARIIESANQITHAVQRNGNVSDLAYRKMNNNLSKIGNSSSHVGNRITSANGRIAHSFNTSNHAVTRHMQSIRDAQSRDYRWLRTAQDMSGATLGLGAAFYKGAKDATTLQQSYIHAGNMAHYGGEKMSRVQHDINEQWRVGSDLSVKYGISQDQIAKGYQALVARGYTTNESLHTQKSLLQAAIASGDNYNDVVKDSTNVLDAYNMRSQNAATMTNNTRKVVNEMAYAADQTATNFQGLGIGMSYVAATAHTTHQSISQTSSALGILSNKGMQASQAGVGLRKVLNSFLSVNQKGQQAQVMKQLGLSESDFKTASGHLKSLGSLMTLLNNKTKNMDSQERGSVFHRFFGATGQEAALNLASDTKGLAQLNKQVEKSQTMGNKHQGYVALLSAHNMKSAQNQFNKFKQAWQAFTITSAREILPAFTGLLKHLDVVIARLNDLSPNAKKWTIYGALAVAAISPISYAIFGIQSAFHGVEMTLLHVRHLFSEPMPNGMTNSANQQAGQQEKDAILNNSHQYRGKFNSLADMRQFNYDHPYKSAFRKIPGHMNARLGLMNKKLFNPITEFGGDAGTATSLQPRLMARLNPFNKSARLFTHRFNPFMKTLPVKTGLAANDALRGTGTNMLRRAGSSILGKVAPLATIASFVPDAYKAFKAKNKTSKFKDWGGLAGTALGTGIGTVLGGPVGSMVGGVVGEFAGRISGKLLHTFSKSKLGHQLGRAFRPLGKSLVRGLHGPMKSITNSWKFIKRGALDAVKPIQRAWDAMFSHESKSSRANLRGFQRFIHTTGMLLAGLWRTASKIFGNVLKYGGRAIAGIMKSVRGLATMLGGVFDLFTPKWKHGLFLIGHGFKITFGGIWDTTKNVFKAIGTSVGVMSNGVWTTIRHMGANIGHGAEDAGHSIVNYFSGSIHTVEEMFEGFGQRVEEIIDGIKDKFEDVKNAIASHISSGWHHLTGHANGGAISHNEMSLVNERGQESAYNPIKNTFRLLGNNGPQVLKLYAGEHVLNAQDTRELLTTGLGKGVTLPGYANGSDKLSNLSPIHGYVNGRGEAIAQSAMHVGNGGENTFNGLKDAESDFNPYSWAYTVPHDLAGSGSMLHKATSVATDLPIDKFSHAAKGLKALHISKNLVKPLTLSAHAIKRPLEGLRSLHRLTHPISSSLDLMKNHVHSFAKSLGHAIDPSALNKNFKKIAPMLKKGIDLGMSKAKNALHNGFNDVMNHSRRFKNDIARRAKEVWRGAKRMGRNALRGIRSFGKRMLRGTQRIGSRAWRGIRRFGRGTIRFGRKIWQRGKRLLSRAGHGISRFSHRTWSNAKRLGRRLWSGTKHVTQRMWSATKRTAGRMWNSAKRTGSRIWSNAKRIARNVGRTAHSLWNKTKSGASKTWSNVVSGARRMASRVGRAASRLFHNAVSRGRSAFSTVRSVASSAVSRAKSMLSGLMSFAHSVASRISSMMSHIHMPHFANGGEIHNNEMALVGERGPETAYNARTGRVRLLGMHGPQITELLAGEQVLTNTQTERLLHSGLGSNVKLPAYAKGTSSSVHSVSPRSLAMNIVGKFNGNSALNAMSSFSKKARSIWDDISDHIIKNTKDTHSSSTDEWKDMSNDITKINSDLSDTVRDIFKEMSRKVSDLSSDLHDGLVDSARDMAEGFGDKFKKLITYAKDDMESVIAKLNKGVRGINTALRAFGGNSHVIHPIHYATGTMNGRIAYNQLGILNDAVSGPRQEAILRGDNVLLPQGDNVPVPLQKGDAVLNGTQTKQMIDDSTTINHYAKGSGFHISDKLVKALTKTLGLALKGPKKFFDKTFSGTIGHPSGHQLTKGIEQTGISAAKPLGIKWTRAMFNYIKSLISPVSSTSDSKIVNYANKYWTGVPYVFGGTAHSGADCGGAVMTILHHFGIDVPHVDIEDSPAVQYVGKSASDAQPGDLVGFGSKSGSKAGASSHIGIFEKPGKMWSEHPLKSGQESINEAAAADGLWGYYRIKGVHNTPKHKNISPLTRLVSSELGSTAIHWLKKVGSFMDSFNGGGTAGSEKNPGGSGVERWRPYVKEALRANHFAASPSQVDAWMRVISRESNGNPSAENNWDINAKEGHPSIGLVQTIGPTFDAYKFKGHDDIRNGFDDLLAGIHYMSAIYGRGPSAFARVSGPEGYANGGWANKPSIFGEAGPEVAINPRRDTADHLIVEAINARMHDSHNSPIANIVRSMNLKHKGAELRKQVSDMLFNHVARPSNVKSNKPMNINISFGNIVVNGNGGNVNTAAIANRVKKAVQHGIQQAAYRTTHKLGFD